ncbi:MAG: rRNA maturation RNase YbeY [Alphaproteobacteria bacterium]|jgi:probable rRNA maturation factor|nr:rRNA maturation RNase YbeY [Alphaproteobacteria bacterium]
MIKIETNIFEENKWKDFDIDNMAKIAVDLVEKSHEFNSDKEISIVFTNNHKVHELNRDYRGKDKSTNILTFAFNDDGSDNYILGELFLAFDVIDVEANEQGKTFYNHCMHILIHGVLHLIGYDHIEDDEAEDMESLEIELLSKINIENPYKLL